MSAYYCANNLRTVEAKFARLCFLAIKGRGEQEEAKRQFWQMTPTTKLGATVTWWPSVGFIPPLWLNSGRANCFKVLPSLSTIWITAQKPLSSESLYKHRTTKHWTPTEINASQQPPMHSRWNCSIKEWLNFNTVRLYESKLAVTKNELTFPKGEM